MYDIIGDIHGHADELEQLLQNLGYEASRGYYRHHERKVIFVGDYIDRGPKIKETLQIVKDMVEQQQAIALMGNHEFNSILYNTKDADGKYLREHSEKNKHQHLHTLEQFEVHQEEYNSYIEWFKTFPISFEIDKQPHECTHCHRSTTPRQV